MSFWDDVVDAIEDFGSTVTEPLQPVINDSIKWVDEHVTGEIVDFVHGALSHFGPEQSSDDIADETANHGYSGTDAGDNPGGPDDLLDYGGFAGHPDDLHVH